MPRHRGIRNLWHGMRLVLIALDDVREHIKIILLDRGEITSNQQGLEYLDRGSQLAIGSQVLLRKTLYQLKVGVALFRTCQSALVI